LASRTWELSASISVYNSSATGRHANSGCIRRTIFSTC
jgi:hypothetical protein